MTLVTISARTAALCACLLALTAQAHAGQHWAYCSVHNDSEVWVSPVVLRDGAGGMQQVRTDFLRVLTEQYPSLHPSVFQSAACFGDAADYDAYDQQQMLQMRNREMRQYSSVHEIRVEPEPRTKGKSSK